MRQADGGYTELNELELDATMRFRELVNERGMPEPRAASVVMNDEGYGRLLGKDAVRLEHWWIFGHAGMPVSSSTPVRVILDPYASPVISFPRTAH